MSMPSCATCVFFVREPPTDNHGHCHAGPPGAQAGWPAVAPTEWCGQHTDPEQAPRFKQAPDGR